MNAVLTIDAAPSQRATAPTVCRHCGEPCGDGVVSAHGAAFCCAGCAAVFGLLQAHDLGGFYTCAPELGAGVSQRAARTRSVDRFAALDDPAVSARLLDFDDGEIASVRLRVPDLHCGSCVWLLERLWQIDDGIVRAEADLLRRIVHVWFRPARLSLRGVAERLASVGYEPHIDVERAPSGVSMARRRLYLQIGLAGFAFGNIMIFSIPRYANGAPLDPAFQRLFDGLNVALALPVLLYSASDYFVSAWRALRARRVTLDVPVALGLSTLFGRSVFDIALGRGEGFMDSFTGLVLFLLVGRLFQQKAFDRIAFDRTLHSFLPLSVQVEHGDSIRATPIDQLRIGDRIVVRPHETAPADARLIGGDAAFDYASVTGESRLVQVREGDIVRAGGRPVGAAVRLAVVRESSQSQLAALWRHPVFARPKARQLADVSARFGAWFTAFAITLAIAGAVAWLPDVDKALQVGTAVLIIACPCALTLAAPITLGTTMEVFGRHGLFLKEAGVALDLARVDTIVFDKTGTLTRVPDRAPEARSQAPDDWRFVQRLAAESLHPVSRAIAAGASDDRTWRVTECVETAGHGIRGRVDGHLVAIGAPAFVAREAGVSTRGATGVVAAVDGRLCTPIDLRLPARPGAEQAVRTLASVFAVQLLSGDHDGDALVWRDAFGDRMAFAQSPEDKLACVRAERTVGRRVLMVGDGLNDAGALAAADVGIAVTDGAACVVPACDAVLSGDRVRTLPAFLHLALRARQVIVACFVVSAGYNAIGLSLALSGLLTPLAAAVLMPVSSLTIVAMSAGLPRWFGREIARA